MILHQNSVKNVCQFMHYAVPQLRSKTELSDHVNRLRRPGTWLVHHTKSPNRIAETEPSMHLKQQCQCYQHRLSMHM